MSDTHKKRKLKYYPFISERHPMTSTTLYRAFSFEPIPINGGLLPSSTLKSIGVTPQRYPEVEELIFNTLGTKINLSDYSNDICIETMCKIHMKDPILFEGYTRKNQKAVVMSLTPYCGKQFAQGYIIGTSGKMYQGYWNSAVTEVDELRYIAFHEKTDEDLFTSKRNLLLKE